MKNLLYGFRHYVDFRGCDTRSQFWGFVIATHLIGIILFTPFIASFMECYKAMLQDPTILDTLERGMELVAERDEFTRVMQDECVPQIEQFIEIYYANFAAEYPLAFWGLMLGMIWAVAIMLPTAATTVRRLRDAGQSPWWVLGPVAMLLPIAIVSHVGVLISIITLVFCCLGSARQEPGQAPASGAGKDA